MRPLLVVGLAILIFSLVQGYHLFEASLPDRQIIQYEVPPAKGEFTLVITLPFPAEGDDFDPVALLVQLDGELVMRQTDRVPSGELRLKLPKVPAATAELYLEVGADEEGLGRYRAVRLQLYRDQHLIGETSLWAEPLTRLEGCWRLTVNSPSTPPAIATEPSTDEDAGNESIK